jgi:hypothetical protein
MIFENRQTRSLKYLMALPFHYFSRCDLQLKYGARMVRFGGYDDIDLTGLVTCLSFQVSILSLFTASMTVFLCIDEI